uniref:Elongation factor 2 n=1 Tax=Zeugodacus cucurbitae TaxID=28588 RepID=A0A0A1WEA1_ZEUCU
MCSYYNAPTSVLHLLILPVILLLLLQCVQHVAAIKCYVCDSSVNPSCANLKSNRSIEAEECTLDKMRTTGTWLFDLNRFAYFDTGASNGPLMNCQKVVAKDPHTNEIVTARFCQLDTADSDACQILGNKLGWPPELARNANLDEDKKKKRKGKGGNNNGGIDNQEDSELHCSICNTDGCNGSTTSVTWAWSSWCVGMSTILVAIVSILRENVW